MLEVRIGERMLLEWCSGCAVMEVRVVRDVTPAASRLASAFQHGAVGGLSAFCIRLKLSSLLSNG